MKCRKPTIAGLRVLVTAGAGGIGRAIVSGLADAGARVHLCDVDLAALAAVGTTLADVSDVAQVDQLFADVRETLSRGRRRACPGPVRKNEL